MFIPSVSQNINSKYRNSNNKISFKAHPDFEKLAKDFNITASSYFRRGPFYGSPDSEFIDIVDLFSKMFIPNDKQQKKILIAGIGNSQEPFSYLAVIKDLVKNKDLSEIIDINVVDLQSKPSMSNLFHHSYCEGFNVPMFASSSFVKDVRVYGCRRGYYRVCDEIFKFLNSIYDNTSKSMWETRLQDAIKTYKQNDFDVVSINNTLGYIENKTEIDDIVRNVYRILKVGGDFITDPHFEYLKRTNLVDRFIQLKAGIYKKQC